LRCDIARAEFRLCEDQGSDTHDPSINLRDKAELAIGVGQKALDALIGNRHRRPILDHLRWIVLSGDATHGGVMHLQERQRIIVEHLSYFDRHDVCAA